MKRTVEIEDSLQERIQNAIEGVETLLIEWLDRNAESDNKPKTPDLRNDLDCDKQVYLIIESSVPTNTKEIKDTWYLYSDKLEQAYENVGFGPNPIENNGMTAIYLYIEQEIVEWYENHADEIVEEWHNQRKETRNETDGRD